MKKQTRSILTELNNMIHERDRQHVFESRGSQIIESAINLIDEFYEHYDEAVINAAFKASGLGAPTAADKDKKPADADPNAKPAVAKGTAQIGDTVTYTNAKGEDKQAVVNAMLDTKDADGDPQIQLKIGSAVFAVDQKAIKSIDKSAPEAAAQQNAKVKELVATITADPKLKAAVLATLQAA